MADSPEPKQAELLRKAVVCLEKKLRVSTKLVAELEAELARAQRDSADLPAVRAHLEEALVARDALEQQMERWQRTAAQALGEVEDMHRQQERTQAATAAAELEQQRQAEQLARWRSDAEALQLEEVRVRGQVEMLAQQVQQLEGANSGLRQDNQAHAANLKAAYEREGELLSEVTELHALLRREQRQRGQGAATESQPAAVRLASVGPTGDGAASAARDPSSGLEVMHRGLFLAAAAELTKTFAAKMEQTDSRASELERRLVAMAGAVEQLRQQEGELRAELQAAQAQSGREGEMAAALLETNLRLHETVVTLVEQGAGLAVAAATSQPAACISVAQAPQQPMPLLQRQQPRRLPGGQHPSRPVSAVAAGRRPAPAPRPAGDGKGRRVRGQAVDQKVLPCREQQPAEAQPAAAPTNSSRPVVLPNQLDGRQAAPAWVTSPRRAAARQAAVQTALKLSAEHRELLAVQRAVAAELQQVASSLAVAPASRQLALLHQHAELQGELRDLVVQLEDKVLQLTALRRAGLI